MRIDLADMEHRLGRAIPLHYREFLSTRSLEGLELTAAAPAEIAALNIEQLAVGADGPRHFGFALYSSDGDCLLVRDGDDSGRVFEWCHETRDISAREIHVSKLLDKLAALPIAQIEAEDPTVVISRVAPWSQSILDPIHFSELGVAAAGVPRASCFECLESINPFTGQPMRLEVPGLRIELPASEPILLKLEHGRLSEQVELRPIPEPVRSMARRLKAQVFAHGS